MNGADDLQVPCATDEEGRAAPIVAKLAEVIGAFAGAEGFIAPTRFEKTMLVAEAIGKLLDEPSLVRLLVLRSLSAPLQPWTAISNLKPVALSLSAPARAAIIHELAPLIDSGARPVILGFVPDLADALGLPPPNDLGHNGKGVFDTVGSFAERAMRLVRSEPRLVAEAREFAMNFEEAQLLKEIATAQQAGDILGLGPSLGAAIDRAHEGIANVSRAAEAYADALSVAHELDDAADQIERVARQRYAAITRRATMLKRHIREDLNLLAEDAAEEFEVDFRRLAEKKTAWFGKLDTADLNDRLVTKNLEQRYGNLTRRYQDQLELLDTEVSEFCDEFTRVGDEALRSMARHEFRKIAPHPSLELRVKAAVDRASTRTLLSGAAGATAAGAAMHAGLMSGAAIAGVAAAPVGVVVLGVIALAGVWKVFANPGERRKRDPRERARMLNERLRQEIMGNPPRFDQAVDAILDRYRAVAVPDIAGPRIEAERIREIAAAHRIVARSVVEAANARIERLIRASQS